MAKIKSRFVYLGNARFDDQRAVMHEIEAAGVCPFCPEQRGRFPLEPAVWEGKRWVLVPNRWSYGFTRLHLMAVVNRHVRSLAELDAAEWSELQRLIRWTESRYALESYSIGVRCGDPAQNGGSVDHLHVHLVVADQNVGQPDYQRVRFPMGPKPTSRQENTPGS